MVGASVGRVKSVSRARCIPRGEGMQSGGDGPKEVEGTRAGDGGLL